MTIIGNEKGGTGKICILTPEEVALLTNPPDATVLAATKRLRALKDAIEIALAGPVDAAKP